MRKSRILQYRRRETCATSQLLNAGKWFKREADDPFGETDYSDHDDSSVV